MKTLENGIIEYTLTEVLDLCGVKTKKNTAFWQIDFKQVSKRWQIAYLNHDTNTWYMDKNIYLHNNLAQQITVATKFTQNNYNEILLYAIPKDAIHYIQKVREIKNEIIKKTNKIL